MNLTFSISADEPRTTILQPLCSTQNCELYVLRKPGSVSSVSVSPRAGTTNQRPTTELLDRRGSLPGDGSIINLNLILRHGIVEGRPGRLQVDYYLRVVGVSVGTTVRSRMHKKNLSSSLLNTSSTPSARRSGVWGSSSG